jgi:hypothetical protein
VPFRRPAVKRTVGRLLLLVTRHSFLVTLLAVALLSPGARCRLGLRDEGPTLPPRPKRFCKTLVIEYRRPKPPDVKEGLWRCLSVTLVELRPGQGEIVTGLDTNISPDPNRPCPNPSSPDLVRVGPDRWRATFRDVYMPYDDEYGNVVGVYDTAFRDASMAVTPDGIILPPEVSAFRRGSYKGAPVLIFHLKEEGRCVAG